MSSPATIVANAGGGMATPDDDGGLSGTTGGVTVGALNGLPGTTLGEWNLLRAVALPLFDCPTTDLDNLSKNPFFFLTVSFGVDSGEVSGDKNAPSSDDTEKDLVCLSIKGPSTVTPEPSPLEVKNTSVSESESVFSGNSFPLLSMKRLGCRGPPSARI